MSDTDAKKLEPVVFPERLQAFDLSAFPCPRCQKTFSAESYGPCPDCVAELQATQRIEGGETKAAAYEPKMNVTPNAVALKDD
jgi:hypothetical protein